MKNQFVKKGTFRILKLSILLFIFTLELSAKTFHPHHTNNDTVNVFYGIGWGINDYGLGVGIELPVQNKLWLYGNGGLSTWGFKFSGGLTFYPKVDGYKSSFSLGYAYATGLSNFEPDLEVESSDGGKNQEVLMELYPLNTINLMYSYNVRSGKKSKFVFTGGYAFLLDNDAYINKSSYELTDQSKSFIDLMAPGGFIFGIRFMIGG